MAMAAPPLEKPVVAVPIEATSITATDVPVALPTPRSKSILDPLLDLYQSFQVRRKALGLTNPGTVDQIAKEVQRDVHLTAQSFSGLRADFTKSHSINPLFQTSHALSTGSQAMSPYTFHAIFATNNNFCQAQLDSDASVNARFNQRLSDRLVFKSSVQIQPSSLAGPGASQVQLEQDYTGDDFTAQLKSINPSILEGSLTGMFIGSYLQSITPRLALGLEGVWQRPGADIGPEAAISYSARYKGNDWIGSLSLLTQGSLQGSYWRRLTDKVETGVDVNLQFAGLSGANAMMGGRGKEGVATLGVKYEFSRSVYRAQVDSQGKVGCLLEKMIAPPVRLTFAGEMDHFKNAAKIGLGVAIEAASEDVMEMQERTPQVIPPF